jgi:hypothetical protein
MDDRAVHFSTNEGRVSLLIGSFRERCHFFSRIRIITWVRMRISVQRLWSFHDQTRNADSQSCTHLFGEDHLVDHPRHNSRPTLARPGYFGNGQPGEPCPVNLGAIWGAGKNAVTRACLPILRGVVGDDLGMVRDGVFSDEVWAVVEPMLPCSGHNDKSTKVVTGPGEHNTASVNSNNASRPRGQTVEELRTESLKITKPDRTGFPGHLWIRHTDTHGHRLRLQSSVRGTRR